MNTKLNLFNVCYKFYDEDYIFSFAMKTIAQVRKSCEYTFEIPLPTTVEVHEFDYTETVNKIFGGTKEVKKHSYGYYLVFDKQLTENELTMWRMFKLGWRSAKWPRG